MLLKAEQEPQLRQIKSNHGQDVKKCCLEMFDYWRQTHPDADWHHLVAALKSPGLELHLAAADIEKRFAGTILYPVNHIVSILLLTIIIL